MSGAGPLVLVCAIAATAVGLAGCQDFGTAREILSVTKRVVLARTGAETPFAPYLDVTRTLPGPMRSQMARAGVTHYVVGPVTGASGMCIPMWGVSAADDLLARRNVRAILDAGGSVLVSFGGGPMQVTDSLEKHCGSARQLAAALVRVIAETSAPGRQSGLDLQLGEEHLGQDVDLLVAALRLLQRDPDGYRLRPVRVGLTLPADPISGFTPAGRELVARFLAGGVDLATVTADVRGSSAPGGRDRVDATAGLGAAAIATACQAHDDLQAIYAGAGRPIDEAQAWELLGLRVSIGENRSAPGQEHPVFTVANALEVAGFTATLEDEGTPLGMLSMSTFNRDHPCADHGLAVDVISGHQWALPQSKCNLVGEDLQFSAALADRSSL